MRVAAQHLGLVAALAVTLGCGRISFDSVGDGATVPVLELTAESTVVTLDGSASFFGTCSAPTAITYSGPTTGSISCDGTFRFDVSVDGGGRFVWELRPAAFPAAAPLVVTVVRDADAPVIAYLRIDAPDPTRTNIVPIDLSASDATTFVSAFCLSWTSSETPAPDAPCWTQVDAPSPGLVAGPTLELQDFPYRLGFGAATYDVRAWVRDEAGNVSLPSEIASVRYLPGQPPVVTDVLAASTTSPSDPPTAADLTAAPGTAVYVKWAASDDDPLPAAPVSLFYTTDDVDYVAIAADLANGANGGCAVDDPGTTTDDGATGCFVWAAGPPAGDYVRVRVVVTDSLGQRTAATSVPLNTPRFRFLAGNTDPGTDASARAALFFGAVHPSNQGTDGNGNMLLTADGRFYFRDVRRGILVVDPSDGIQRVFIPTTGTSSGDGGPAANATLRAPLRIALVGDDELLVFDHDRIRRVSLSLPDMPIDTLIGGGDSTAESVPARDLLITPPGGYTSDGASIMTFFALPNGDIYFQSEDYVHRRGTPARVRVYRAATNTVESLVFRGEVAPFGAGIAIDDCQPRYFGVTYDLVTSEIDHAQIAVRGDVDYVGCAPSARESATVLRIDADTGLPAATHPTPYEASWTWAMLAAPIQGLDGNLYLSSRTRSRLFRYDPDLDGYAVVAGSGVRGRCPDGTPALECDMDPLDVFVTQQGQIWILDFERIRVIDEAGNLLTVMGQPLDFGDGGRAESARFAEVTDIGPWSDGGGEHFVLLDKDMVRFRELRADSTMRAVAGTGRNVEPDTTAPATSQGLRIFTNGTSWGDFVTEPSTGAIWFNRGTGFVARLDRATGLWSDRVGGGTTVYHSVTGGGVTGLEVDLDPTGFTNYPPQVIGLTPTDVLVHVNIYDSGPRRHIQSRLFEATRADGSISVLMGVSGEIGGSLCADGTRLASCPLPLSNRSLPATWDDFGSRWLFTLVARRSVHVLARGSISTLASTSQDILGFAYRRTSPPDAGTLFTCGGDGALHIVDVATGAESTVTLPSPTMACSGGIQYLASRDTLLVAFEQNGSAGVAEYLAP